MTRIPLALAALFMAVALLLAPREASACISCEYVPEVARSPAKSNAAPSRSYRKERSKPREAAPRRERPSNRNVAKRRSPENSTSARVEKEAVPDADAETETSSESVTGGSASGAIESQAETQVESAPSEPKEAASATTTSTTAAVAEPEPEKPAKAGKAVGCRKFSPEIGKTITVPCE